MKKTLITLLVATVTLSMSSVSSAATVESKATYKAAKETASANYKTARPLCDSLTGNPKNVCVEEAKAARSRANAEAEATYKDTLNARTAAAKEIAMADYSVAKAKCGALTGNDKDICIKEAKSAKIAATADAKADKKVINARADARDDKHAAEYKVAMEKCDALAGPAKDACVASVKQQFGK